MRVLLDRNGLQTAWHLEDQKRLSTFVAALDALSSCTVGFSASPTLVEDELSEYDVLVITTRYPGGSAYSPQELTAICEFVRKGGGLLLMSNHGDWPGRNDSDLTQYDAILAGKFGIEIECAWFEGSTTGQLTEIRQSYLLNAHPIIYGDGSDQPVGTIVTNNCCSIVASTGAPVAALPSEMLDRRNRLSPEGRLFAHALDTGVEAAREIEGRVVTIADSGFVGTEGTRMPGPGLIGHGDNLRFVTNAVQWLGRQLG